MYLPNVYTTILTFLLLIWNIPSSTACSCDLKPFDEAIEWADEIFVGELVKVVKVEESIKEKGIVERDGEFFEEEVVEKYLNWQFHFEVQKKWKGSHQGIVVIHKDGTSCDFLFDIYGKSYLVYASKMQETEKLSTWLCSRTMENRPREEGNTFDRDVAQLELLFPDEVWLIRFSWYWKLGLVLFLGTIIWVMRKYFKVAYLSNFC